MLVSVVGMLLIQGNPSGSASFNNESAYASPPCCRFNFSVSVRKKVLKALTTIFGSITLSFFIRRDGDCCGKWIFPVLFFIISHVFFILLSDFGSQIS
jgi:hypothetical protein